MGNARSHLRGERVRSTAAAAQPFELKASSEDGFDGAAKIGVTLANADSRFSQIEREKGFKGSQVSVRFLFFDLAAGTAASEAKVVFRGVGAVPDEITEASLRVTFTNRLSLQRILLPEVRIARRCPWLFPSTADNVLRRWTVAQGKVFAVVQVRILGRPNRRGWQSGRRSGIYLVRLYPIKLRSARDV